MGLQSFVTFIQCDPAELPTLRSQLGRWLAAQQLPPRTAFHVKLAAHEVAKNVIDHSAPCDFVKVRAVVAENDVVVEVFDTSPEPVDLEPPETGEVNGLALVEGLARRVEAVPRQSGTALVVVLSRN